jgi:hypothetical protein
MYPDCRANLEYMQTVFRCLWYGRTFLMGNGVIQAEADFRLKDYGDLLNQTVAAASQALDKIKSTRYENLSFAIHRDSKRPACSCELSGMKVL